MIELFANVAQILGFLIQTHDYLKSNHTKDAQNAFGGLLALSRASQNWKSLHSKYHPLGKQLQSVVLEISEHRNDKLLPKRINDIAPNPLRSLFYEPMLYDVVMNFEANVRPYIRGVASSLNKSDRSFRNNIMEIRRVDEDIADKFEQIADWKDEALQIHDRFLAFLKRISMVINSSHWDEYSVGHILDNRPLLVNDIPRMIYITDNILMCFLDIYIKLISDYTRAQGLNNLLSKK